MGDIGACVAARVVAGASPSEAECLVALSFYGINAVVHQGVPDAFHVDYLNQMGSARVHMLASHVTDGAGKQSEHFDLLWWSKAADRKSGHRPLPPFLIWAWESGDKDG